MTNNDILRRFRYAFDLSDFQIMDILLHVNSKVLRAQVCDWLRKEEDETYLPLSDIQLANFLNGFIIEKRGKRNDEIPIPEKRLNNNMIIRKIKIALALTDDDLMDVMKLGNMPISKHELSAFFRNPNQRQYRPCNDQLLRGFLVGLQKKYKKPENPLSTEENK